MKSKILLILCICVSGGLAAQTDSLTYYLQMAAANNPLLKSEFLAYKASLERVPQAGAYPDPQLEMGFFIQPMEILDGQQIADVKLMQMFPWFGTRRAARSEASEMARMAYEQFRGTRDNLFFEVKSAWYALLNLQQQQSNIRENKVLLNALRALAVNRFTASSISASAASASGMASVSATVTPPPAMGGMSGMGGTGNSSASPQPTKGMGQMASGGSMGNGMGNGTQGGMSNVLQIDLELNELENEEQAVRSQIISAKAKFNSLLNRSVEEPVLTPDSITQLVFSLGDDFIPDALYRRNPMLGMANAEAEAYKAKRRMDKKMGLPMFGVGLQYSVIGKRMEMGIPTTSMNGKDMVMPMVSLTIPLYRGKYKAQQKESHFMQQAAEEKYRNVLNSLAAEYVSAREQLADAQRKVELYEKQQQLARVTYQLALSEFAAGANTVANVLDIERQLLDYTFKRSNAVATYNTIVARITYLLSDTQTEE